MPNHILRYSLKSWLLIDFQNLAILFVTILYLKRFSNLSRQ